MTKTTVGIVLAIAFAGGAAMIHAQARGGGQRGAGAPGQRGAGAAAATSTIERITVHGKALEGNLENDSPDREATVYLPPSYAGDQNRRFPVIYLLHGYGGRDDTFTTRLANLRESSDRLAGAQGFSSAIVVTPNAYTLHMGSMYSNSPTTGDWERFIAEDLVAYMDSHYRTLPSRLSRGLAGHSMGGYGALRIGMKRPDVFGALYAMSTCCLDGNRTPQLEPLEIAAEGIKTRAQAEEAARATAALGPSAVLASAAAWSPNPNNPPLFLDLPRMDGKVRPEIAAKWVANSPIAMLAQYAAGLGRYYGIAIDIGTKDPFVASNQELHAAMTKLRIAHSFEEYDGDHTNRVRERLESRVLMFFSKNLVAPANPTSPQIKP